MRKYTIIYKKRTQNEKLEKLYMVYKFGHAVYWKRNIENIMIFYL